MSQALHPTSATPTTPAQTREFWVSDEPDQALRKMKLTLNRVGQLLAVIPGKHIDGTVRFGVQSVNVKITWVEEEATTQLDKAIRGGNAPVRGTPGTRWILEATSDDKSGQAQRSAMERLEDAYLHFDAPDYTPDRLGVLPYTIIGILVAIILFSLWLFTKPAVQKRLPNMPAAYLDKGSSGDTSKDTSAPGSSTNSDK